jgi:hypothetical protein
VQHASAEPFLAATLRVQPERTEIGLPVRVTLSIRHGSSTRPAIDSNALALDDSWVVFEEEASLTLPDPTLGGGGEPLSVTSKTWEIASLEPGSRALGGFALAVQGRDVQVEPVAIEVKGLLASDQEEPRALRGFRDVGDLPDPVSPLPAGISLLAVILLFLVWTVRKRRKARPAAAVRQDPLERIAALEAAANKPEELRAVHYELTELVRSATDLRKNRDLSGLTDEEWLERTLGDLTPEFRDAMEKLFASAGEVKYGGAQPTSWAVRETLSRGRTLLAQAAGTNGEAP